MAPLLVNVGGVLIIGLIVWWFWGTAPQSRRLIGPAAVEIIVADGVYTPARLQVAAGDVVRLSFIRKDPGPCAGKVIFPTLGVSADLPMGEPREIVVTPERTGEYEFTCQMGMYRGKIVAT